MKTKTVETAMQEIERTPLVRDTWQGELKPGEHIRQGDVQISRVAKRGDKVSLDLGNERITVGVTPRAILAEGESIQIAVGQGVGSRHVIEAQNGVRVCQPSVEHPLVGPVIEVDEGSKATLTHPEHRHFELGPGLYQATFQRDWLAEETARVQD